jgi:hypothetical protein
MGKRGKSRDAMIVFTLAVAFRAFVTVGRVRPHLAGLWREDLPTSCAARAVGWSG